MQKKSYKVVLFGTKIWNSVVTSCGKILLGVFDYSNLNVSHSSGDGYYEKPYNHYAIGGYSKH